MPAPAGQKQTLDELSGDGDSIKKKAGPKQNEEEGEEEEYDALFIKRLLDLYREKNIPLSILYGQ